MFTPFRTLCAAILAGGLFLGVAAQSAMADRDDYREHHHRHGFRPYARAVVPHRHYYTYREAPRYYAPYRGYAYTYPRYTYTYPDYYYGPYDYGYVPPDDDYVYGYYGW